MEYDDEIQAGKNSYTTEFRQYDPRLGRWKSLDPLMAKYPNMSPYVAFNNNPIVFTDKNGLYETKGQARRARRAMKKEGYEKKGGNSGQRLLGSEVAPGEFIFTTLENTH